MLNNITLPNEFWGTLQNFDNYLISNLGRIWSKIGLTDRPLNNV